MIDGLEVDVYAANAFTVHYLSAVIDTFSHTLSAYILTWFNSILYILICD